MSIEKIIMLGLEFKNFQHIWAFMDMHDGRVISNFIVNTIIENPCNIWKWFQTVAFVLLMI